MTGRGWRAFVLAGLVATVVYEPAADDSALQILAYSGLSLASSVALVVGTRGHPRERRRPWQVLAAGQFLVAMGDLSFFGWELVFGGDPPFPGFPDVLYLVGYALIVAAFVLFIRVRTPGRDWGSLLDATIIATGFGIVMWVFLIEPYAADPTLTPLARVVTGAYPAIDIVMFAVVSRLAVGSGSRPAAFYFLSGAIAMIVLADTLYGFQLLAGTYQPGGPLDAVWMTAYTFLGAAALHPSSLRLTEPTAVQDQRLSPGRLALLAAATLLAPAVDVLAPGRDHVVTTGASAALFLLVIARMAGLLRALERSKAEVEELQRRRGERRFQSLVQNAADVVMVLDSEGSVTFASPSAARVVGDDPTGWHRDRLLALFEGADVERFAAQMAAIRQQPTSTSASMEVRFRRADGAVRQFEVIATNLLDDPDVCGLVLNGRDISERAALEEQLRHLAFHDPLTGLANRSLFGDRVRHALDRINRTGDRIAVLFCDLDDFKTVNDSLGHQAGDELLVTVAERFNECLRAGDTAARLGGDEFGILLEDLVDVDQAGQVAERLLDVLRQPVAVEGTDILATASVGVAFGSAGQQAADVLRNADAAMYEAKAAGKSGWKRYEPSMQADALNRLQLTADLNRALERSEFFLVYQPIVRLDTAAVVGVEALVRWMHPERGLILPTDFIPLAEETGQVVAIGRWVLREACRQASWWLEALGEGAALSVSVNVSARQLHDPRLLDEVMAALRDAALPPECLVLELTESVLLRDPHQAMRTFAELKRLGVRLAIDDFGTGYSSLGYLQRLPVDIIKIDKTFVDDLGHGSARPTLTRGIVELTRTLGVVALAEGIEQAPQVDDLNALGCELGQGYYFARPLSAAAVSELLVASTASAAPAVPA